MTRYGLFVCLAAACLHAQQSAPWNSYAHDAQHTGLSTIGAQRLERIKWSTPVDQVLAGSSGTLYIHYGSVTVTAGNTVLVPVRTSSSNTYQVEAHSGATGALLYTLPTDFTPAPHNWIPSYAPALSRGSRLYYAGAGGTVYYRDQLDSATGPSGQIAFYGDALYAANAAAFHSSVMISTPITADAAGNIYFGFDVVGSNPANLTSGLARIGADGTGAWVSAAAAAQGDASIVEVSMNCAPAVSNDGSRVYFAVSEGPLGTNQSNGGYLVALNSTTLAPVARIRLKDPETGLDAELLDDSSASPTVGPDGDVYYGVFESSCCSNDDRGWLLHFDSNLAVVKTPGAFGWDTTASVVPAASVASYHGPSSYLLFTKYNNYLGVGPGGNGQNKIAVLDPNTPAIDPITGTPAMQVVIAILGPTLDPPGNTNGSVREWCINSGAIDPFSNAAIANSEDGVVYRWDFASNSFKQSVRLTAGVGEAYTPTAIGADGAAYAINDANLFAVGQAANLTIVSSHSGNFAQSQTGAAYMLTVTNSGTGATGGLVSVAEIVPSGLTATAISGQGWTCTQPAGPCTRSDSLAAGASYPPIALTVNVAANAPATVLNTATVSSDGALNSVNATATDSTTIAAAAVLGISKTHSGNFTQGQTGATYTVTVSNTGAGAATGTVSVSESLPAGLSLVSMTGTGWTCSNGGCQRGDSLAGGASYPAITVTVNVAFNAASPQVNQVSVAGPGIATASASDSTVILTAAGCSLTLSPAAANVPATGTALAGPCLDPSQPNCGFAPETPLSFTVTPSAACGAWSAVSSDTQFVQITSGASGAGVGSVNFAAFTNTHTTPRRALITVTSGTASAVFTLTEAGSGDNVVYRQVYALYEQLLGRDPDSGGLAFWTGVGEAGLGQMADSFLTSPEEFNTAFAAIAAYQGALGRAPGYAQFAAAVDSIRGGQTVASLFTSLAGTGFTAAALYRNLLNRPPAPAEVTAFNTNGAAAAFAGIIGYPSSATPVGAPNNEFQSTGTFSIDHTNALYIDLLYFTILGRDPDPAGFSFWTGIANAAAPGLLFQGASGFAARLQIVGPGTAGQGFIGSPEFQNLFAN